MPLANHLTLSICHIRVKHIFSSLGFLSSTCKPLTLCILPKRHRRVNAAAIHFTRPTHAAHIPIQAQPPGTPLPPQRIEYKPFPGMNLQHISAVGQHTSDQRWRFGVTLAIDRSPRLLSRRRIGPTEPSGPRSHLSTMDTQQEECRQ